MSDASALSAGSERRHGAAAGPATREQLASAYEAHYVQLVRLARQLVDDVDSAEEAVQDVFVRLHRRGAVAELRYAYLRKAVVNQCRSMLRRRLLARRPPDRAQLEGAPRPDALAGAVADRDQVRRAISRLSRRQREVVVMRYYEDLSLQEIATTLGITVNATSAALSRARESISAYVGTQR